MIEAQLQDWPGDERRSIPIHILNFVDEKMESQTKQIKDIFEDHEIKEMARYSSIEGDVKDLKNDFHILTSNITSFMDRTTEFHTDVKAAFPKNEDGNPDFGGHASDHKHRISTADQDKEVMAYIRDEMKRKVVRSEDQRFVVRAVLATVLGLFILWAGSSLFANAVHSAQTQGAPR